MLFYLHYTHPLTRKLFACMHHLTGLIKYRKVPKVATVVTFGISSLWGSLLSGSRYFQGFLIFGKQKTLNKGVQALILKNKRQLLLKSETRQNSLVQFHDTTTWFTGLPHGRIRTIS